MKRIMILLGILLFMGCEAERVEPITGDIIIWSSRYEIELTSKELGTFWIQPTSEKPNSTTRDRSNPRGLVYCRFENLPIKTIRGTYITARGFEGEWELTPLPHEVFIVDASFAPSWE